MPNPRYLTVAQTAELLQVCRETVYKWIRNREIDYLKLPGLSYRIPRDALEEFLQPAENPPPPQTRPERSREIAARLRAQHRLQKMIEENRRS
jgi:excisionase family DNA binding protein